MDSKTVVKKAKDLQADLDHLQAQALVASEVIQRDWLSPAEAAGLRAEVERLTKMVETQKSWARSFAHRSEQEKQKTGNLERQLADARLTLATLCDLALGLDAGDRSDKALIRSVGKMVRRQERIDTQIEQAILDGWDLCARIFCTWKVHKDGTCSDPANGTPECHEGACPYVRKAYLDIQGEALTGEKEG